MAVDADGNNLVRGNPLPPGLPGGDSLAAAVSAGRDIRPSTIGARRSGR